jgi:hypothetical protein
MTTKINKQLAYNTLFKCPETGKDLFPCSDVKTNKNGSYSFEVSSKDGKNKWKHTIKTEEV